MAAQRVEGEAAGVGAEDLARVFEGARAIIRES
jgi:hypothetical protein